MSTAVSSMPTAAHHLHDVGSTTEPTASTVTEARSTKLQEAISYIANGFLSRIKSSASTVNAADQTATDQRKSLFTDKGLEPVINTASDPNAVYKWQDTSKNTEKFKKKFKDIGVSFLSQEGIQANFDHEYKEFNTDTHVGATFCLDANEIGEDVTVVNKYDDGFTLTATYDGHGGPLAGRLLARELNDFIHDKLTDATRVYGGKLLTENDLFESVVKEATVAYDTEKVRTRRRLIKDGAVGTIAISRPDGKMTYALTGDCKPYEFRQASDGTISAQLMLKSHDADHEGIMSEIASKYPNAVRFDGRTWRFNGSLMPLRAFYDEAHKEGGEATTMTHDPLTLEPIQNGVMSAEPTIVTVDPVTENGTRIGFALMSDGWDAIGQEEISEVLNSNRGKSMKDVAAALYNRLGEDLSIPAGLARKLSGDDKGSTMVFDKYAVGSEVETSGVTLRAGDRLISDRASYV